MKAIKAIYEKGKLKLSEEPTHHGPVEVVVVFPEPSDDPWEAILNDPRSRPALARRVKQVRAAIAKKKTQTLDLDEL